MRKRLKKLAGRLHRACSGNATLLVALAMPVLIGGAGLAVDTAQWYVWKRELQFAADQAAIAGAWSRAKDSSGDTYRLRARQELESNQALVDFAAEPEISLASYAGGSDNSVLVAVTATRSLPFSSFLTGRATTIAVQSQASFEQGANYTSCLLAVDEHTRGAITIGGNASLTAGCGMAALSDSDDAVVVSGNPDVDIGWILAAGGIDDWFDTNTDDEVHENLEGLFDPYADLTPPNNPTPRTYACTTTGSGRNRVTQASLLPGTYRSLVTSCNTTLAPGIYVLDGGNFVVRAQDVVTGSGVMFVLRNGAGIRINGGASITLTGMTVGQLVAAGAGPATAGRLAGILVFEDRNSAGSRDNLINGNAATVLNGVIYLPRSNLTFSGTAGVTSQCLLIAARTITLTGTAAMEDFCPPDLANETVVAITPDAVRLVA